MCGGVLDFHCDTTACGGVLRENSRETSGEGRLLVGRSIGLSSRSKLQYLPFDRSQEPGVAAPAILILPISAAEPEVPRLKRIFGQRDRVLCLRRLNFFGAHQGSVADQALNLGLLFFANVPYAI